MTWDLFVSVMKMYGIPGAFIFALLIAVVVLWKTNQKLHKQLLDEHEKYQGEVNRLYETRIDESAAMTEKYSNAMREQDKTLNMVFNKMGKDFFNG